MQIRILTERELRQCVAIDLEAIEVVADAFTALAGGAVVMPPILRLDVVDANGEVDVKTAYVPGLDGFAIKVSPGFFDNPKLGLPSGNGLMVLLSAKTGMVEAVLLDNGYLTAVRTAAAGAVAARHLSRQDSRSVGLVGAGGQARLQVEALRLVRPFDRLSVWARDRERAARFARDVESDLNVPVSVAADLPALVADSDIVVTTTPARTPLIEPSMLKPGLHITAMGSDAEEKNEIHPHALAGADRFVCDSQAQSARLGELHHAIDAGAISDDFVVTELGDITSGAAPGRGRDAETTICDLTGTGVQDTAIATYAFQKAMAAGLGTVIDTD